MEKQLQNVFVCVILLCCYSLAFGQNKVPKSVQFGKGITYEAKDTSLKVKFNFRMQNLFSSVYDQASEEWSSQFLVRRSRLKFGGYALSPKLEYKVELGLTSRDISVNKEDGNTRGSSRVILDAVLKWKYSKHWTLWVGQTKLPGNRERVISSANLQFVNRSILNSKYNIDRDAGIQLRGKYNVGKVIIAPSFAITQGEGRNIASNNVGGYDYTAHLEFLPFGAFASKGDFSSSDLAREQTPKLAIGLTFDYNDGAVRQGGQLGSFVVDAKSDYVENSLTSFFADLMFKYKGFSILSEYANKTAADEIVDVSKGFLTGTGFNFQMGYLFDNNVELAVRYTSISDDSDLSGISDETQYTLGLSKYIVGHNLKFQTDLTRIAYPDVDDGKLMFRMQVEMQF